MTLRERWQGFSPRERNLVLGAVAVAVILIGRNTFFAPSEDDFTVDATADRWESIQKIRSYRKVVGRRKALLGQRDEILKRISQQQKRLIDGATPTQVGAELQGIMNAAADTAGMNVLSSQILRLEEKDGYRRVGVRMTLSGSLGGVSELVAAVESGEHDLAITNLEINRKLGASRRPPPRPPVGGQAAAAAPPPPETPLTVSVEVRTFMKEAS